MLKKCPDTFLKRSALLIIDIFPTDCFFEGSNRVAFQCNLLNSVFVNGLARQRTDHLLT